jgi:hypothetical protein
VKFFICPIYTAHILSATYRYMTCIIYEISQILYICILFWVKYNAFNGWGQSAMTETFSLCWRANNICCSWQQYVYRVLTWCTPTGWIVPPPPKKKENGLQEQSATSSFFLSVTLLVHSPFNTKLLLPVCYIQILHGVTHMSTTSLSLTHARTHTHTHKLVSEFKELTQPQGHAQMHAQYVACSTNNMWACGVAQPTKPFGTTSCNMLNSWHRVLFEKLKSC